MREETTLEIDVGAPFATWLGRGNKVYLVGYRCRYVSGEVRLSDEHSAYRWVNATNFRDLEEQSGPFPILGQYFALL